MKRLPDHFLTGILLNAAITVVGVYLFAVFYATFKHSSVSAFLHSTVTVPDNAVKVIGLAQVLSIPVFFFFLNRYAYKSAKGVILMFFLVAITTAIVKFM